MQHPDAAKIGPLLQRAVGLQQQGQFGEAAQFYQEILRIAPEQFDALHLLGVLRLQQGDATASVDLIDRALRTNPQSFRALTNRGIALMSLERNAEAVASFEQALTINPHHFEALRNQGVALARLERDSEAIDALTRALASRPEDGEALANRGLALARLGHDPEAIADFQRALSLRPNDVAILNAYGVGLANLDRVDEARALFDRALALDPRSTEALNNRGNASRKLGRHADALVDHERARAINPQDADAWLGTGDVLNDLHRFDEAIAAFDRAIAIKPDRAEAQIGIANALSGQSRYDTAAEAYAKALALKPDFPYGHGHLLHAKMHVCDWSDFDRDRADILSTLPARARRSFPLPLLAISASAADQLACARNFVADRLRALKPLPGAKTYAHDRIRVAYVSADFHEHPVSYLIAGVIEHHDRARFEPIAISFGRQVEGPALRRLKATFDRFIDVRGKSDQEIATLMRELEIDIAVDLMGHTHGTRPGIFALRASPVQVNMIGFPGTTGADFIDYIIADPIVVPPQLAQFYSERIVSMPETFQPTDDKRAPVTNPPSRAASGLPAKGFVFCCFNNSYKITPQIFDVWMRLLQRVEGSVLWTLAASETTAANLRREAGTRGVDPARIVFAPRASHAEYLARYATADLFLDTLPFNAGTTASDALWAGLPLLTCSGEAFASRMAASLLSAIGLPELATNSLQNYEELAVRIASDPAFHADIKARLARNRATFPLFNTARYTRHLEHAYTSMCARARRGEVPVSFDVPPIS